jgi:hypothetical protein
MAHKRLRTLDISRTSGRTVAFTLHMRKSSGSNTGVETDDQGWIFSGTPEYRDSTSNSLVTSTRLRVHVTYLLLLDALQSELPTASFNEP